MELGRIPSSLQLCDWQHFRTIKPTWAESLKHVPHWRLWDDIWSLAIPNPWELRWLASPIISPLPQIKEEVRENVEMMVSPSFPWSWTLPTLISYVNNIKIKIKKKGSCLPKAKQMVKADLGFWGQGLLVCQTIWVVLKKFVGEQRAFNMDP